MSVLVLKTLLYAKTELLGEVTKHTEAAPGQAPRPASPPASVHHKNSEHLAKRAQTFFIFPPPRDVIGEDNDRSLMTKTVAMVYSVLLVFSTFLARCITMPKGVYCG